MKDSKQVLMIAPYFLPRRRVGSLRPFKFAIHLKEFGWEPHILTIASPGYLTDIEQRLLGKVTVHQLHPPFDLTGNSGSQLKQKKDEQSQRSNTFSQWIDRQFPVDTWLPFFWIKLREIKGIANKVGPDMIWSTGDPWSAHWVAHKICDMFPAAKWVADFRDPWTLTDTDLKDRSRFASLLDRRIERKLVKKASVLSFTSKSTQKLYTEHFSDLNIETVTIYNSFDENLVNNEPDGAVSLNLDPDVLNLIFFGKFRSLSSAKPIIDILSQLKKLKPEAIDKIHIHSFGNISKEDHTYAKELEVRSNLKIHDPVPPEQGINVLQQSDLLLLSTNPDRKDIIPAKLWDYLMAGRPVLSIAPNPEIQQILTDTGTGTQFSPHDTEGVARLLVDCVASKQEGKPLPIPFLKDFQNIDKYKAKSATAKLASIFEQQTR